MSAHTPGPWIRASASGLTRVNITNADQSRVIGSVIESRLSAATNAVFGETVPDLEGEANARLIVAAPELLDALQTFANATLTYNGHVIGLMHEDFERARVAIAKATGEKA